MLSARLCAFVPVVALCAACAGCISHRVGSGVLRNMMQPSRDPDPTADFTREQVENPWAEPSPPPSPRAQRPADRLVDLVTGRTAAMIAAVLAGAMPALVWSGTFEENRLFEATPRRPRIGPDERGDGDDATRAARPP
jgi:hypothetical protein